MDTTALKSKMNDELHTLDETAAIGYTVLNGNVLEVIKENLKNQPLSISVLDVVKAPSGGATVFSVPGIGGDAAERELTGVILDYTTPRAYWDTADPVEDTPPVCMSRNSLVSEDGKVCAHCAYNDFGSKDGDSGAKACKESVLLLLLRPGSIFPLLVRVPVTSKLRFVKYMTRLVSTLTPISSVVTKITLKRATSRGGKPYALFNFEAVGKLSPEEAASAREFGQHFMELLDVSETEPVYAEAS